MSCISLALFSDLHKLPKSPYHIVEDSSLHSKNEGARNANNSQTAKKFKELKMKIIVQVI
jgi:hypothetical protein